MRLHALLACHNRRDLTVSSLTLASRAAATAGIDITFTVFDDGSSDGTAEAIALLPVEATVIQGDGSAFWARSMAFAERVVLRRDHGPGSEHVLWLNDDVVLDHDAFVRLTACIQENPNAVVVGAVRDPTTGIVTYSGMRRSGSHPLSFARVEPSAQAELVDTFNGNIVAVPIAVAGLLGGIDGGFSHGLADIDYGLRCKRIGVPVLLAPGTYGTCPRNEAPPAGSMYSDWLSFVGPKGGGNFSSLRRILIRSNPFVWPVIIAATYGLWWGRRIMGKAVRP